MRSVTSLYGALAGAASIFIGILTALLVNQVISMEVEQSQLEQRVGHINVQREGTKRRRDEADSRMEMLLGEKLTVEIEQQANEDLDVFLNNSEFSEPEIGDNGKPFIAIRDQFQQFVGDERWSTFHYIDVLGARFSEVQDEFDLPPPPRKIMQSSGDQGRFGSSWKPKTFSSY